MWLYVSITSPLDLWMSKLCEGLYPSFIFFWPWPLKWTWLVFYPQIWRDLLPSSFYCCVLTLTLTSTDLGLSFSSQPGPHAHVSISVWRAVHLRPHRALLRLRPRPPVTLTSRSCGGWGPSKARSSRSKGWEERRHIEEESSLSIPSQKGKILTQKRPPRSVRPMPFFVQGIFHNYPLVGSFLQVHRNFSQAAMQININRLRDLWNFPKSGEIWRKKTRGYIFKKIPKCKELNFSVIMEKTCLWFLWQYIFTLVKGH